MNPFCSRAILIALISGPDWNSLSSGLIGAFIGGGFALAGSWYSHHLETRRKIKEEKENQVRILLAVKIELESCFEFLSSFATELETSTTTKDINRNLINIFNSLQRDIALIENCQLSSEIMKLYKDIESFSGKINTKNNYYESDIKLRTGQMSATAEHRSVTLQHECEKLQIECTDLNNEIQKQIPLAIEAIGYEVKRLNSNKALC